MASRRRRASDEDDMDLRAFFVQVRKDLKYKKFKRIVTTAQERLNLEKDRNEAFALHAGRTSRTLHARKQYSPKALLDASSNDLAARARLVEIRVKASFHIDVVDEACDALRRYLFTQYKDEFNTFSTEAQRKSLVERIQGSALDVMIDGKSLLETLDFLIKDIDQAGFRVTAMIETLKLLDGSKGGRIV